MKSELCKDKSKKICVCGAGHQGIAMAGYLALNGERVVLWNRSKEHIKKIAEDHKIYCHGIVKGTALIETASDEIKDVVSKFIMVTVPSNAHADVAQKLAPYVDKDSIIILNPGRTFGAIDFAANLKKYGVKKMPHIAETQTIVYTCRKSSENSATIFAMKEKVAIASLQKNDIEWILSQMPACLKSYFISESSVVTTSLSNVGMILHCVPVLMNVGWIENEKVNFKYYYDGISKSVAHVLEKMDCERIKVARQIGCRVESTEEWLKRIYKLEGTGIYECIRNNSAYREIDAPPDLEHTRYILEDVPEGLVPVEYVGKQLQVDVSTISLVIDLANVVYDTDFRKLGRQISVEELKKYL